MNHLLAALQQEADQRLRNRMHQAAGRGRAHQAQARDGRLRQAGLVGMGFGIAAYKVQKKRSVLMPQA
jgi:hypothetical protein